jgi:hypothetical protein
MFGLDDRLGIAFRAEFFNIFRRNQSGALILFSRILPPPENS